MAGANQHQSGLLFRVADRVRRQGYGDRHTRGLQGDARRQVSGGTGDVPRRTQHHIHPIGNEVVVRIAKETGVGVQVREIEVRLVAPTSRPASRPFLGDRP